MVQKVRKGEELNETNLKLFLKNSNLISDIKSDLDVLQFSNGFSNLTYLLIIEDKEYVIRKPPKGAMFGHDMGREYKVLKGLNRGFDKAPKAYAYTTDHDIIGSPFYIMEKVNGVIITPRELKENTISAKDFSVISKTWLDTLVELHQLDYNKLGLSDLGRPEGYVERQVRNWSKQYLKATTEDVKEAKLVMKWLNNNLPTQYKHSLVHNDYKYDNVVFSSKSWSKINSILDWEMCTIGDPLMDLGTSIAYWAMSTDHIGVLKAFDYPTSLDGNPSRLEIIKMYEQKTGEPVNNLVFYYVFGLFKIAVIVQQIFYRYSKGLTTNEKFKNLDQVAKTFCKIGWQSIQKNKIENLF
ncbi:MAG: phosphotransferase family protein [Flavobacteriaceae bacterium]|jgi:aminoglycoside phosphotransferase (APT) family kinase protein|nr:phosphotransferase family protein [Flavobacteriaceae bacterium]MBT4063041.1 phosphotransferase family protein [Flavobacteriaceae bacterium]MBT4246752.1 phosphotransferase family protein [Flavobacteriaceae bacterium]MBT7011034.1 phosphotransferase family protein [Flavobacteriaceae bacterium]MBT7320289.1 phosphotransferase family protein [Flavobacteriaceae bacterium]